MLHEGFLFSCFLVSIYLYDFLFRYYIRIGISLIDFILQIYMSKMRKWFSFAFFRAILKIVDNCVMCFFEFDLFFKRIHMFNFKFVKEIWKARDFLIWKNIFLRLLWCFLIFHSFPYYWVRNPSEIDDTLFIIYNFHNLRC